MQWLSRASKGTTGAVRATPDHPSRVRPPPYRGRMQSERARQKRRERKRLEREQAKKEARKAQMCAGDELDFIVLRRVAALFNRPITGRLRELPRE